VRGRVGLRQTKGAEREKRVAEAGKKETFQVLRPGRFKDLAGLKTWKVYRLSAPNIIFRYKSFLN
jgi:hypothetical protein